MPDDPNKLGGQRGSGRREAPFFGADRPVYQDAERERIRQQAFNSRGQGPSRIASGGAVGGGSGSGGSSGGVAPDGTPTPFQTDGTLYVNVTGAVDGANKDFVLPETPTSVDVAVGGGVAGLTWDYTLTGNTISFVNAPEAGVNIVGRYWL